MARTVSLTHFSQNAQPSSSASVCSEWTPVVASDPWTVAQTLLSQTLLDSAAADLHRQAV